MEGTIRAGKDDRRRSLQRRVFIYALFDPRNGLIGYVGASLNPELRLRAHFVAGARQHREARKKEMWLQELVTAGVEPHLLIVEVVPESEREEAEDRWAQRFYQAGHPLTNNWWMNREKRARKPEIEKWREQRERRRAEKRRREYEILKLQQGCVPLAQAYTVKGCSRATVYLWVKKGLLSTRMIRGRLWVDLEELKRR